MSDERVRMRVKHHYLGAEGDTQPGQIIQVSRERAQQLIAADNATPIVGPGQNKPAGPGERKPAGPGSTKGKADATAGEAAQSSSSQAAQASRTKTSRPQRVGSGTMVGD